MPEDSVSAWLPPATQRGVVGVQTGDFPRAVCLLRAKQIWGRIREM